MELEIKQSDHVVPSYSLTGDLLSYLRCKLQYRYHNRSSLPPSRPVQLWFGEFLHGALELAFNFWKENPEFKLPWPCTKVDRKADSLPSWVQNDIGKFAHTIETSLLHQGKQARSEDARNSAYKRVEVAINKLGPYLFPLIQATEKKVIGTRKVPQNSVELRCSNYEVHGVIDVLTNVSINQTNDANMITKCIKEKCSNLNDEYEVVVDYKGTQRPNSDDKFWRQGDWQVQTYAWLRGLQPDSLPVSAGILLYINELTPGDTEMKNIQKGILKGTTDIFPIEGTDDERIIKMWRIGNATDQLSLEFRLRRAIRVIPINKRSSDEAVKEFDDVVRQIEEDIVEEAKNGNILKAWGPNCEDDDTCSACDFRYFCPKPANKTQSYRPSTPSAP